MNAMNAMTLGILLHYYWSPEQYEGDSSTAEEMAFDYLRHHELISVAIKPIMRKKKATLRPSYQITEKGRTHIKALLAAPFPVRSWTSPIAKVGHAE